MKFTTLLITFIMIVTTAIAAVPVRVVNNYVNATPSSWRQITDADAPLVMNFDNSKYFTNPLATEMLYYDTTDANGGTIHIQFINPAIPTDKHGSWKNIDFQLELVNNTGGFKYIYVTDSAGSLIPLATKKTINGRDLGTADTLYADRARTLVGGFEARKTDGGFYNIYIVQAHASYYNVVQTVKREAAKNSSGVTQYILETRTLKRTAAPMYRFTLYPLVP